MIRIEKTTPQHVQLTSILFMVAATCTYTNHCICLDYLERVDSDSEFPMWIMVSGSPDMILVYCLGGTCNDT